MNIRPLVIAALGMGMAVAVPAVAQAYTSYTTASVNLRAGPGTGYASYGALPGGIAVNVRYCQGNWCSTSSSYGSGWVSASYLSSGPVRAYPRVYPRVYPRYAYPYRAYPYRPYPYRAYPYPYYRERPGFNFFFRVP